ncbi:MAG: PKD domain-containing protein, partial [Chitinophagaceae bacterium]
NCTPAKLTLGANAKNATSFIWDFGDGTLSAMSDDTFATHTYPLSGVYRPTLIMKDVAGCSSIFEMKQLILLDSIDTKDSIVLSSNQLCNEGVIAFDGNVKSLGNKAFGQPNKYEWNVGNGLIVDSSHKDLPKIYFHQLGAQNVQLQVTSPGGCKANFTNKILVKPSAKPQIHGLKYICMGEKMQLSATSNRTENIQWNWKFENGNTSQLQQPIPQIFTNTKSTNTIELITNLDGCLDTVVKEITVYERPLIQLTPNKARLCLGDSIQLTAHNGSQYEWLQAKVVTANPTFFVRPNVTSHYSVKAINKFGCEAIDSTLVEVVQPLKLSINSTIEACLGSTVQLQVNGADKYQWMNVNNELSNAQIANPTTVARKNTKYKVVGFDKEGCFTDTTEIGLIVHALPTVQAGNDIVVGTGSSTTLKPTYSSDVQRVQWFPTQYLNAANSTTPIVTPKSDMTYIVTATSKYGCEAKDSIRIHLQCIQDNLFLPTGFTPNKNGLNDVFYPLGRGIKVVKHFTIYNRAGQLIFEKSNFQINDKLAGWNGKFQGHDQPMGTYIYSIEVECDTNEIFSKKGTITLIR